MKIEKNYKEIISEVESKKTKYGCVMLYMKPTKELIGLQDDINDKDVYSKLLDGKEDFGRTPDDEYHVTVLYGLHGEVTDEQVKEVLYSEDIPTIELNDITLFTNDDFDVVKVDIKSEGLNKLNKEMCKYPYTTDYPDYHPHMTISYVKSGEGKQYERKLDGLEATPSHYVYSKVDGSKVKIPFK